MASVATFLHVTDTHLSSGGTALKRDDAKVDVPRLSQDSREAAVERMFDRLAEQLRDQGRVLDGVIFSGDAQDRGRPGGHQILFDLIIKYFGPVGITPDKIVAVPGNHDVPVGSDPSSAARYEEFTSVWRKAGCITPWLDGVDAKPVKGAHRLVADDGRWAVYALNSCNWSHTTINLSEPLASVWDGLPALASSDPAKQDEIKRQLNRLRTYDMARVSPEQLESLRSVLAETPKVASGHQVRIAVLHHHLRAPTLREELKPFADVSNLEQVRAFLRSNSIDVVVHGHKHEHSAQYDHIYDVNGEGERRTLVISGATFEAGREDDAARLITLEGLPFAPSVSIVPLAAPRGGQEPNTTEAVVRRIWTAGAVGEMPTLIAGSDLDQVYAQVMEAASREASGKSLIVHLDLAVDQDGKLPVPNNYPFPADLVGDDRQEWLRDLVDWWQLERSQLEHRVPYAHGARIKRFGGKIDQLKRVVTLLKKKSSTRALAVLIDPFRDFTETGDGESFASFCLVEFKRRDLGRGKSHIDAIAFYRAQEFARWWPINVAELRQLQMSICRDAGGEFSPGYITTITADARTYARAPTQVSMPIIDRWLDQAPERLHLLANALTQGGGSDGGAEIAVKGWSRTLDELEAAAATYNPDGVPIAVDGLFQLASYMKDATKSGGEQIKSLVSAIERLARTNSIYDQLTPDRKSFDNWAPSALESIRELRELTSIRMGKEIEKED